MNPNDIINGRYQIIEHVDNGGFASVFKANDKLENCIVAIKLFPPIINQEERQAIINEMHRNLQHDRLLTARHVDIYQGDRLFLIMDFCEGGNLSARAGKISENQLSYIILDICSALQYLHQHRYAHNDLKLNNLLSKNADGAPYMLADLGLTVRSRNTIRKSLKKNRASGSDTPTRQAEYGSGITPPPYRAPELFENANEPGTAATDMFAFGVSVYELLTNRLPLGEYGGLSLLQERPRPIEFPEDFSTDLKTILSGLLNKDWKKRPTAEEMLGYARNFIDTGKWFKKSNKSPLITTINMKKMGCGSGFGTRSNSKFRTDKRQG